MSDTDPTEAQHDDSRDAPASTAVRDAGPTPTEESAPACPRVDQLPPFRVILHNDDVNDILHVVETIELLTPHNRLRAYELTMQAHTRGRASLLVTHRERAELFVAQFRSRRLTATMEPAG